MKTHRLEMLDVGRCRLLERNPQTVSPASMAAMKRSIKRYGMVAPILVRPKGKWYEIVSGNHRFMACQELGLKKVPAVVAKLSDGEASVLAVNLNLIHGNPTAEQLAPFLGDMADDLLREIHLEGELLERTLAFDAVLGERLKALEDVPGLDHGGVNTEIRTCMCPTCGKRHQRSASAPKKDSKRSNGSSRAGTRRSSART